METDKTPCPFIEDLDTETCLADCPECPRFTEPLKGLSLIEVIVKAVEEKTGEKVIAISGHFGEDRKNIIEYARSNNDLWPIKSTCITG